GAASSALTRQWARTPWSLSRWSAPAASMLRRRHRSLRHSPCKRLHTTRIVLLRLRRGTRAPRRRRRRIRKLRLLALLVALLLLASVAFTLGLVRAVAGEIPALDPAKQHGDLDTYIYDSNT